MSKTLIVGGEQAFIKGKWREHLESVGLELAWHWDYKRKRLPEFPPTAEAVILIQDMCSHRHRRKASSGAKKHGIPFAEVSRQWIKALPALEKNGIISSVFSEPLPLTTNQPNGVPMSSSPSPTESHPEFNDYLDILFLEGKSNPSEIEDSLRELLYPYSLTEQNRNHIRLEWNKRQLAQKVEEQSQEPVSTEPPFYSEHFLGKVEQAKDFVEGLTKPNLLLVLNYLSQFNGRKRTHSSEPSKGLKNLLAPVSNSPTKFAAAIILICQQWGGTIEPNRIANFYRRISKAASVRVPEKLISYFNIDWNETIISIPEELKIVKPAKPKKKEKPTAKEKPSEAVQVPLQPATDLSPLLDRLDRLEATVGRLVTALENSSSSKVAPSQKDGIHLSKDEILRFLLENNKLNLSLNSK